MHRERLEQAIRVLEQVKVEDFYIECWYMSLNHPDAFQEVVGSRHRKSNHCGFVACAIGHMARDPWFNAQGLTLTVREDEAMSFPSFAGHEVSFTQVADFFGVSIRLAMDVFSGSQYEIELGCEIYEVTPTDVAAKLRQLLES
jgi:hypothetical protein